MSGEFKMADQQDSVAEAVELASHRTESEVRDRVHVGKDDLPFSLPATLARLDQESELPHPRFGHARPRSLETFSNRDGGTVTMESSSSPTHDRASTRSYPRAMSPPTEG